MPGSDDVDDIHDMEPAERVILYRRYLDKNPDDAAIWFDLGLAYKLLRDWNGLVQANQCALSITNGAGDPAWWNLGIGATALRNWKLAREAWRGYGLTIDDGEGPLQCDYGQAPVRLPHGEVVWGNRIDAARLIIRNIPFPDSGYRWGDVVLHDGAPNGERQINGQNYPVFDVLERWSPSEIATLTVDAACASSEDSAALIALFDSNKFAAEDWTANVRNLCSACSHGLPEGHDHPPRTSSANRAFGVACPKGLADRLLREWQMASPSTRSYDDIETP